LFTTNLNGLPTLSLIADILRNPDEHGMDMLKTKTAALTTTSGGWILVRYDPASRFPTPVQTGSGSKGLIPRESSQF
jgi:hypothetical protein